jgi:PIN domain nuclease of toxin-antitoxin system
VRLLLDTHALLWWLLGDPALSPVARNAIADPGSEVFASAASACEITTKFRIGKLPKAAVIAADIAGIVAQHGFIELPLTIRHGQLAGSLPGIHKDPFDRILVAQAILADMQIVSRNEILSAYGIARLW